MRCKKHITDRSSSVGVCASCLRERLFALVEAQARSAAALQQQSEEDQQQQQHQHHRKSDPLPPPLIFPRSVSPYICRRSDDSSWHQNQNQLDSRFYSTPQLGPSSNTFSANHNNNNNNAVNTSVTQKKKKHTNRFSILSNLFRSSTHRSVVADEQPPPEHRQQIPIPVPIPDPHTRFVENSTIYRASVSTPSPISSAWYSSLIPNRRKTTQESPSRSTTTNNSSHHHRRGHHRNKGLSPNCTEDLEREFGNGVGEAEDINNIGGYLSESSPGWRKQSSTTATPGRQRRGGSNSKSGSGGGGVTSMAFCLSPLVRASPKRPSRNQKDGFSGEIRAASSSIHHNNKPNLSTAASFCANRSRKLANFGRYNNYNP
ncbi:hypothetical protein MKX03_031048 [Papaver bracteatum]|nr:hypothetical protein MKX03_031048 [Papaver bracteatum]